MLPATQRLVTKYCLFLLVIVLQVWFTGLRMHDTPTMPGITVEAATCPVLPAGTPSDTLTVQIPAAGTYKIWTRMRTPSDTANAYWLKIDSDCPLVVGDAAAGMPSSGFIWVGFRDGSQTTSVTAALTGGQHILTLLGKEPGVGIDSLLFTTDMTCTPTSLTSCSGITVTPGGATQLVLSIGLHGIGSGGDNTNPNGTGNMSPQHSQRTISVVIYDSQNQQAAVVDAVVSFNTTSGKFAGTATLPSSVSTGVYTAKVGAEGYLRKTTSGILTITKNQSLQMPDVFLTTGDANLDNQLSILDYNLILDCYSDLLPARNCADAKKKQLTDLNDDGKVNELDYNIFLRELSTQGGQ